MKLLDKYLLRTFVVPFIYCFLAFAMIYVIYDLFDNLPDFVEGKTPLLMVARYYAILLPSVMVRIVPISLLLAVLYALSSLTKNNEITAMRACGLSLFRLMIPFMGVGLLVSVTVAAVNETLGPRSAFWCSKFVKEQKRDDPNTVYIATQRAFKNNRDHRIWIVNEFDIRTYEMRNIEVVQQRPDGLSDEYMIKARSARWLDGRWWFSDIVIQQYDEGGNPVGHPKFVFSQEMTDLTETPTEFLNDIKDPEFLSSLELINYINTHPQFEEQTLARYKVDLHYRLALPWASFIVSLLGIPFGSQTGRKGAFRGVALCIGLLLGYYFLSLSGMALGKGMVIPPWLAGWLPNIFFLGVGAWMVSRMR